MGNFSMPVVHTLRFTLVGQIENVVHLFHLKDLAHVLELVQQREENLLVEQDSHAPAFSVLLYSVLEATAFNLSEVDRNCVVNQNLLDSSVFFDHAFN